MKAKKGDIIVRTDKAYNSRAVIGKLLLVGKLDVWGSVQCNGWPIDEKHYRLANAHEIKAYYSGIRHIDEIFKNIDNFSII